MFDKVAIPLYSIVKGVSDIDPIFEEDLNSYSVFELADWIYRCRTMADSITDDQMKTDLQEKKRLAMFCEDWHIHSMMNPELYGGYKYKRAINLLGLPRPRYILTCGDGATIDITDKMSRKNDMNYRHMSNDYKQNLRVENKRISEYQKNIDLFVEGEIAHLFHLISAFSRESITCKFNINESSEYVSSLSLNNVDEFLKGCRKVDVVLTPPTEITYTAYCNEELKKHGINKNTYYAYLSTKEPISQNATEVVSAYQTEPRIIGKSFFTNIAFLLSLNITQAEKLYQSNGYSIAKSGRNDDKILNRSFQCGFPRRYANTMLESAGYPSLELGKQSRMSLM